MRILAITDYLRTPSYNGSEVFCAELLRALGRNHELEVITRHDDRGGAAPAVKFAVGDEVAGDPERLREYLRERVRTEAYDVVYNLGALAFGCAVVSALPRGPRRVPLVNHFQALLGPYAHFEKLLRAEQESQGAGQIEAAKRAHLNIFLSQAEFRLALQFGFKLAHAVVSVIPNGLPAGDFEAVRPDDSFLRPARRGGEGRPVVIATAGRFGDYAKGADLVYRAFVRLYEERRDVFLLSVGNSDRFSYILRGLPGGCYRVLGWQERGDFLAALAASDFAVLPSRYEPFGLIALEAMALGVPVVANSVGGLSETVDHEKFGLLNPLKDGSLGLFLAMKELAADVGRLKAMGEAARAFVRREYALERVCGMVEKDLRRARLAARALGANG